MPEPMLVLADVRVKVKGGVVLPAHAFALVLNCGALARSSELFAGATNKAPITLSSPFDEYAEADVARFLKCIYNSADATARGEDAALPAVVRLAHALDAAPVLAASQRHLAVKTTSAGDLSDYAAAADLALLCGWDDVLHNVTAAFFSDLQLSLHEAATPAQLALSDAHAFAFARDVVNCCSPEIAMRAVGNLAASYRRLHSAASAEASISALLSRGATEAAVALSSGTAVEVDGRFIALASVPNDTERAQSSAVFRSRGLEWKVLLFPNGTSDVDDTPRVGVALMRGWPKKVSSALSMIGLTVENANPRINQPPLTAHDSSQIAQRCAIASGSST